VTTICDVTKEFHLDTSNSDDKSNDESVASDDNSDNENALLCRKGSSIQHLHVGLNAKKTRVMLY
jgi:hypothetical protein